MGIFATKVAIQKVDPLLLYFIYNISLSGERTGSGVGGGASQQPLRHCWSQPHRVDTLSLAVWKGTTR